MTRDFLTCYSCLFYNSMIRDKHFLTFKLMSDTVKSWLWSLLAINMVNTGYLNSYFKHPCTLGEVFLVRPCILHWLMGFRQIASLLIRLVQETLVHLLLSHQTIVFITIAFSLCWFCGFSSYFSSQCQFEREDDWWMPHFVFCYGRTKSKN